MKIDIVRTLDGSDTLYLEEIGEHYHSTFGAVRESIHVFVDAGLRQIGSEEVKILEIGFGTGLNCFLTLLDSLESLKKVHYTTLEKFPLGREIWSQLRFFDDNVTVETDLFSLIHESAWNVEANLNDRFALRKIHDDVLQWNFENVPKFDLVYFDAFSPEKQPELWEKSVFERIYNRMNCNGILVTYCAKGSVRRALQATGFRVERIPGPPGKREMIRAKKLCDGNE